MAQSYLPQQRDARTYGAMQARLLDDLNRHDLVTITDEYLQDAIRYFGRMTFFFSDIDNRTVPTWQAGHLYPQGSTVKGVADDGLTYAFVALQSDTASSGSSEPAWPNVQYFPLPGFQNDEEDDWSGLGPEWGVITDGDVTWGNTGRYRRRYHTQLSTVPGINQYTPPIDYVSPYMLQMTTANARLVLDQVPFERLSRYDVIQPAPIAAYPTWWAFFQQQIYCWVYPAGFYPITPSYIAGPLPPITATDSNYWTTIAERLIRKYAQCTISREVLYDQAAAQLCLAAWSEELSRLKAVAAAQQGYRIPPPVGGFF